MPPDRFLLISIAIQSEELLHHIRRVCDVARFIVLAYRLRGGEKLVVRRDDIIMGDGEHVAVIPAQQLQLYKPVAVAAAEFWEIGGGGAVGVSGLDVYKRQRRSCAHVQASEWFRSEHGRRPCSHVLWSLFRSRWPASSLSIRRRHGLPHSAFHHRNTPASD